MTPHHAHWNDKEQASTPIPWKYHSGTTPNPASHQCSITQAVTHSDKIPATFEITTDHPTGLITAPVTSGPTRAGRPACGGPTGGPRVKRTAAPCRPLISHEQIGAAGTGRQLATRRPVHANRRPPPPISMPPSDHTDTKQ